jgi:hypothetical protein
MNKVIFETISEIPAWIQAHPRAGGDDSSVSASRSIHWDARMGYDGAIAMAEDGGYWPEGAAKMVEATTKMDQLKHDGIVSEIDYDVTGHYLDIDEYLSGSPECWERVDEEQSAPVVSIGVQAYTPASVDQEDFTNRGAALLSVIDDLEAKGIRCELWTCVSGKYRGNKEIGIDMRVCLKRAEENWSPSSVAFGMGNAAFSRRIGFRVAESFKDLHKGYLPSHRLAFDDDRPEGSEFDVWFGYQTMVDNIDNYGSVAKALKNVTEEVEKQLKERGIGNDR